MNLSGGTNSRAETVKVTNDFHSAAREAEQRAFESKRRIEDMVRAQQRQQAEQQQREQQNQQRQQSERQQQERERQQRQQAEDAARRAQRTSSGNGNGTPPPGNGGYGGSGGRGSLDGYAKDIRNLAHPNATIRQLPTDPLNKRSKAEFEKKYPDKTHILPYQPKDILNETRTNPSPDPKSFVGQAHADGQHGNWHFSIDEMAKRRNQLYFGAAAHHSVGKAVEKYLDLSYTPTHFSIAKLGPTPTDVWISHTVSGKQQAEVQSRFMDYSETRPIDKLLGWLKLK